MSPQLLREQMQPNTNQMGRRYSTSGQHEATVSVSAPQVCRGNTEFGVQVGSTSHSLRQFDNQAQGPNGTFVNIEIVSREEIFQW